MSHQTCTPAHACRTFDVVPRPKVPPHHHPHLILPQLQLVLHGPSQILLGLLRTLEPSVAITALHLPPLGDRHAHRTATQKEPDRGMGLREF
jgi:hypothetical protein